MFLCLYPGNDGPQNNFSTDELTLYPLSIKYKPVPKKDPFHPDEPVKYYAQVVSSGVSDLDDLAERISKMSSFSPADTVGVTEAYLSEIPDELLNGQIVKLGRLGSLSIQVTSTAAASAEELGRKHISGVNIKFRPSKEFKQKVMDAVFIKMHEQ